MSRLPFLLLLSLLFLNTVALAQTPAPNNTSDARESDKTALRKLGAAYEQAINNGDLRSLAPMVGPNASAVFETNDEVKGLDAMQSYFDSVKQRLGPGTSYAVQLNPDDAEFLGDVALAHGTSDETVKPGNGHEFHFSTHWTAVLQKDATGWKALRLHVSMNPFDNPMITARLQMRTTVVAVLGLVLAGIAFVLGFISRKPVKVG
jgi:ketosteroid isomerase-like protein